MTTNGSKVDDYREVSQRLEGLSGLVTKLNREVGEVKSSINSASWATKSEVTEAKNEVEKLNAAIAWKLATLLITGIIAGMAATAAILRYLGTP